MSESQDEERPEKIRQDFLGLHVGDTVKRATDLVRKADAAQYERPAIPAEQRGQIRVRLLNATPDPLGSIAALNAQYSGRVIRDLSEVTDEERQAALDDMQKTVLNGPLEAVQFHFQVEGVTRSITHQMVRSRAAFFAQESLRFAVPEGDWAEEIPLPPSLSGIDRWDEEQVAMAYESELYGAYLQWKGAMRDAQKRYNALIEAGIPAEEARGVLPHDMPTRLHWVVDLRTLLAEAGKRTCTQAQFPWRMIFAGVANALRKRGEYAPTGGTYQRPNFTGRVSPTFDGWQFQEIANALRPVCFQTGNCGFMAAFDRNCKIRPRVEAFAARGIPSSEWDKPSYPRGNPGQKYDPQGLEIIDAISSYEWALDPTAARS